MARLFDRHRTRILHQKKHSGAITPPEELSDQEEDQLEPEQEIPRHSHGGGGSYGVVTIDGRRSWDMVVCEACGASSLAAQILIISEREGQSRWIPAPIWSVSTLVPPYNDLPSFDVSTAEGSYDLCVFLINIVEDHPIINMKALRKKKVRVDTILG